VHTEVDARQENRVTGRQISHQEVKGKGLILAVAEEDGLDPVTWMRV
jgi:hypothetical protein